MEVIDLDEKKYLIWLSGIVGIGSVRFRKLISYFNSAKNVFKSSKSELLESKILPESVVDFLINNRNKEKLDKYMYKMKEIGVVAYTIEEEQYPRNLINIYDPPPVLYVKGELVEYDNNAIAIVGSRRASEYGNKTSYNIARELAKNSVTVVSGMAIGIDSAAHKGAIAGHGRTIAVFACGLSRVYPSSNISLAKEIIKNGAIVSEYPLGIDAMPHNFPARNRIISGLSNGVVVVEAGEKSGSLITADFALEQGRDVFAVPGNINSYISKGTNLLLKNGAKLVTCVNDILEEYNMWGVPSIDKVEQCELFLDINSKIIQCLKGESKSIDKIIEITQENPSDIISAISLLEIKGIILNINGLYHLT